MKKRLILKRFLVFVLILGLQINPRITYAMEAISSNGSTINHEESYKALQEQIKALETKVDELTTNVKSLEDKNAELEKDNEKLIAENEKLEKEIAEMKEKERLSKLPPTLRLMEKHDYIKESVTGISEEKVPVSTLNEKLSEYGKLYGTGMPYEEYKEAMGYEWIDCTDYKKNPTKITVDLTKNINYKTYVDTLKKLSRYDGVYLYKIGKSTEGRDLYAIEIDVESKNKDKQVFMLTGSVHGREFAGGSFTLKMFVDLVQKAQTDSSVMEILKNNKYVAVPIINVDVREEIIKNQKKWTTSGNEIWKAYINGTDGNRNFPGLAWGEVSKGNKLKWNIEPKATYANYAGDYAGSNNETKALMKWLYHYTIVEKATCLLDMHQQGRVIYAGKGWSSKAQEKRATKLRTNVLGFLNKGNSIKYIRIEDEPKYGLNGTGSTITDYAVALSAGAKFSPAYGFSAFTDGKKEYILMEINDVDDAEFKIKAPNPKFATLTVEIGYGKSYLGSTPSTRNNISKEYTKYHFNDLLVSLPKLIN